MAAIMPPISRFFFTYVEPVMCMYGALEPIIKPQVITNLLPFHMAGRRDFEPVPTKLETLLALQYSTLLFMISLVMIGVMVYGHKAPKVVHVFVLAFAVVDIPHWASFAYVLGWEGLAKWRLWSPDLWARLLTPVFTCSMKVGYLMGVFGPDRVWERDREMD